MQNLSQYVEAIGTLHPEHRLTAERLRDALLERAQDLNPLAAHEVEGIWYEAMAQALGFEPLAPLKAQVREATIRVVVPWLVEQIRQQVLQGKRRMEQLRWALHVMALSNAVTSSDILSLAGKGPEACEAYVRQVLARVVAGVGHAPVKDDRGELVQAFIPGGSKNVLVVTDNEVEPAFRLAFEAWLTGQGHQVRIAAKAGEADIDTTVADEEATLHHPRVQAVLLGDDGVEVLSTGSRTRGLDPYQLTPEFIGEGWGWADLILVMGEGNDGALNGRATKEYYRLKTNQSQVEDPTLPVGAVVIQRVPPALPLVPGVADDIVRPAENESGLAAGPTWRATALEAVGRMEEALETTRRFTQPASTEPRFPGANGNGPGGGWQSFRVAGELSAQVLNAVNRSSDDLPSSLREAIHGVADGFTAMGNQLAVMDQAQGNVLLREESVRQWLIAAPNETRPEERLRILGEPLQAFQNSARVLAGGVLFLRGRLPALRRQVTHCRTLIEQSHVLPPDSHDPLGQAIAHLSSVERSLHDPHLDEAIVQLEEAVVALERSLQEPGAASQLAAPSPQPSAIRSFEEVVDRRLKVRFHLAPHG